MDKYYVYLHRKPDGTVFYVGKGQGKRAINFARRSAWHKSTVAKYGRHNISVEFLYTELSDDEAKWLEIATIAHLRELGEPLINLTDGGDGVSGVKKPHTPESRRKISLANKGRNLGPKNGMYGKPGSMLGVRGSDHPSFGTGAERRGWHHTPEAKKAIKDSVANGKHPMFGKPRSTETRERVSTALTEYMKKRRRWITQTGYQGNPSFITKAMVET